jgi:multiple sugar transport system substrate-binding protein
MNDAFDQTRRFVGQRPDGVRAPVVRPTRRSFLHWGVTAAAATAAAPALAACGGPDEGSGTGGGSEPVTLKVMGFEVNPEEKGTPLDKAYKKFLADFEAANTNIKIDSLPTPPEFATQIIVDLASGTAPDLWSQDASSLAPLIDRKLLLDMRKCIEQVPALDPKRFFPAVLAIHEQDDGAIYGLPNDFTPMVVYYNTALFDEAKLEAPVAGWTWDDQLSLAQQLTRDGKGRAATDAGFDADDIKQYGYRAGQYAYQWVYRTWQNGGDVLSPDRTTASGFLDAGASMEALQWYADLVLKHKVAPKPSVLDSITEKSSFEAEFIAGRFAMFDSGHWSLVGLQAAEGYQPETLGVVPQPMKQTDATVLYESSFVIRHDLPEEKIAAAGRFVEAATGRSYQDTKAVTGIAIAGNQEAAQASLQNAESQFAELDPVFVEATEKGRPPSGSQLAKYPTVEKLLDEMMERILAGGAVETEAGKTVQLIDQELESR